MAKPNNKDKNIVVDESILEETPPNINEPQKPDPEDKENQNPNPDEEKEVIEDGNKEQTEVVEEETKETQETEETTTEDDGKGETPEQKDKKYKAQQSEAQIQAARNKHLLDKVQEAKNIADPTEEELKAFVAQDGVSWDELTTFEQAMAKKTYLNEKKFALVQQAADESKKTEEWATKVDEFIDTTDGKPEFVELSGHEADFRRFAMQESHRGTPIDILLGAFLHNLPPKQKKRGSLFEVGGGGEKSETPGKMTDVDEIANLRITQPKEYKRRLKAGLIAPEA